MKVFEVQVCVLPKENVLDPQGRAVGNALETLGLNNIKDVKVGRQYRFEMKAFDAQSLHKRLKPLIRRVFLNSTTEMFECNVSLKIPGEEEKKK